MITTLFPRVSILLGLLFLPYGTPAFYRANALLNSNEKQSTHYEVSYPEPVSLSNSFLLVALEQYLGRDILNNLQSPDFKLISGGRRPLILKDPSGLVHKSAEITIGWKKEPLQPTRNHERQVIGPFASFESANRISTVLRDQGIEAVVAHPLDWEVWLPNEIQLPKEINVIQFQEKVSTQIKPVLKLNNGNFLLAGSIEINAPDGLRLNGGLYKGPFILQPDAYGSWTFIEKVLLEKYLLGVVPHEIGPNAPASALASQAVLARTWALANANRFEVDGYHLCSNTQCQVYKDPEKASIEVSKAIDKTAGKILTWKGKPISAVYHATNGGVMAEVSEAWAIESVPYLQTNLDGSKRWTRQFSIPLSDRSEIQKLLSQRDGAYGNNHYLFRWKRKVSSEELQKALLSVRSDFGLPKSVSVIQRGPSGRVVALKIVGNRNQTPIVLKRDSIRRILTILPSTLFVINELKEGGWQFSGGGFGHGAGLSQAGAIDLALRGWTTQQILKHYYPGTTYESLR